MSFNWNWNFPNAADLMDLVKTSITQSISSARIPEVFVEPLRAVAVDFGDRPPTLEFDNFPRVSKERTHVVFRLSYSGTASITLETLLQANSLIETYSNKKWAQFTRPTVVAATSSLVIPFKIRLYNIELDTLVDIVYTPNGVTVAFRGDPVVNLRAESSLDEVPGVQDLIRKQLKIAISDCFLEDIPEGIWKATCLNKTPPDPYFGPRRWSQHLVERLKFRAHELSPLFAKPVPTMKLYDGLSLRTQVPYAVLAAPRRAPGSTPPSRESSPPVPHISISDLLGGLSVSDIPPPPPIRTSALSSNYSSPLFYGADEYSLSNVSLASGSSRYSSGSSSRATGKKRRVIKLSSAFGQSAGSPRVNSPLSGETAPPQGQAKQPVKLRSKSASRPPGKTPSPHSGANMGQTASPPAPLSQISELRLPSPKHRTDSTHSAPSNASVLRYKLRSYSRTHEGLSSPLMSRVAEWTQERSQPALPAGYTQHASPGPNAGMAIAGSDSDWAMPAMLPARFYPPKVPEESQPSPGVEPLEALARPAIY